MTSSREVLVVEDEFLIALELEETLRRAGYQVVGPVASVEAAMELLRHVRPDVAVLDLNLSGERVTPVAEVLQAMAVPFVLASAYSQVDLGDEEVFRNAVNLGKPTIEQRLLQELSHMLNADVRP